MGQTNRVKIITSLEKAVEITDEALEDTWYDATYSNAFMIPQASTPTPPPTKSVSVDNGSVGSNGDGVSGKKTKKQNDTMNRKPNAKPKRAMSAYNLFFRYARQAIVSSSPGSDTSGEFDKKVRGVSLEEIAVLAKQVVDTTTNIKTKRKHRKTHGKIGFQQLARVIAAKWKCLDEDTMSIFEEIAKREKLRYKEQIAVWNQKQTFYKENPSLCHKETHDDTKSLLGTSHLQSPFNAYANITSMRKEENALKGNIPNMNPGPVTKCEKTFPSVSFSLSSRNLMTVEPSSTSLDAVRDEFACFMETLEVDGF